MIDWRAIAPDFAWDGSWRDIYVLETSEADWQAVWEILRRWSPAPIFSAGGTVEPMPDRVAGLFEQRERAPFLRVVAEGITLNCHFFGPGEIEFDCDPREVTGPMQAETLAGFMRVLGEATKKKVILTPENLQTSAIARYSPDIGEVVWNPL